MPVYDGVVSVAEDDIPVIVELDDDLIRLSASGTQIGQWRKDECEISHLAESIYTITAEDEVLSFIPSQPNLFAAAVNGGVIENQADAIDPAESDPPEGDAVGQAPPPTALTMGFFYALCVVTVGLAIWSLISIIF